jgi:uncharacterized RDD family membrane protein YckC
MEAYTPLEAIAAALEGRIPSIRELRPEVPPALAAVLTRALDPDRENRLKDHAAFRQALIPWSSQAPTPAPLGVRFLAGLTDVALLGLGFSVARGFRVAAQQTSTSLTPDSTDALIAILLLCLCFLLECLSGGSPGKWLLGLRLATAGGGKVPAAKVLLRAAVFAGILTGAFLLWVSFGRGFLSLTVDYEESVTYEWSSIEGGRGPLLIIPFILLHLLSAPLYLYLALFQRISRHPEHAARHDRLSGIRVVLRSLHPMRQTVPEALEGLPLDWTSFSEIWGPIQVGPALENGLRVGIDPVLHRRVFLEKHTTAFPEARRWCARTSRLRWLQSVRDGEGTLWEVWQAPSGSPLTALTAATPIPWTTMLDWMRQIAREISEADHEGTQPEHLSLGHVWITADYRALLLDAPWESLRTAEDAPHSSLPPSAIQACQHLLFEMMQACPHWERPLPPPPS